MDPLLSQTPKFVDFIEFVDLDGFVNFAEFDFCQIFFNFAITYRFCFVDFFGMATLGLFILTSYVLEDNLRVGLQLYMLFDKRQAIFRT